MNKISFVDAVRTGLKKSFDVTGTATRREFWYFLLFRVLVGIVTIQVDQLLLSSSEDFVADAPPEAGPLTTIAAIALLIPSITVQVRRMRDAGWSAWWMALWLIPIASVFVAALALSEFLSSVPVVDEATLNEVFLQYSAPFVLLTAAVQLFLLVLSLLPSRSREQGNKYAQEA
jgi:uncharacterized membrane protein YhaH (DUF805 family)